MVWAMATDAPEADTAPQPRTSRVRAIPRTEAFLTGPENKEVVRGGLVFDEVIDPEDRRAIFRRSTIGHRDWGKFVGDVFSQWFDLEGEDEALIAAIVELNVELRLQAKLWDTVKHAGIDGHALLYKNFSDTALDPSKPVQGAREVVSLHPIYEPDVREMWADKERTSARFGLLDRADVFIRDPDTKRELWKGIVHHSRVFHVAWEPLYGSLKGTSYFDASHDSYKAIKNLEWAMGETFARNAAGTKLVDPGEGATDEEYKDLETVFKDLDASKEIIVPHGTKVTTLKPQPIPPKDYAGYFLKTVSTMPETLLVGAHEGAVTGSETNLRIYFGDVKIVQEQFVTPMLLDYYAQLQELGILPEGDMPVIAWRSIWTLTQEQEAMIWERMARASRALVGNPLRGDAQLMTPQEIRRIILGLPEEPEGAALAQALRTEQMEIPIEARERVFGAMERRLGPVIEGWTDAMLTVNRSMRRAVLRQARAILAGRLDTRGGRHRASRDQEGAELLAGQVAEAALPSMPALATAVRDGFAAAILAGVASVEVASPLAQRADQAVPLGLVSWWEANSTHWSTKLSTETVAAIKTTVRDGLLAGDSMAELEARLGGRFDFNANRLEAIARTETIRAASEGRIREYQRVGVERLVFMATPDERTSQSCLALDGTVYSIEAASGIIPVHPFCRCTWVAEQVLFA